MNNSLLKRFSCSAIILLFTISWSYAQRAQRAQKRYTVSGYVKEKSGGELVPGASLYVPELRTGVITNVYGFYSLSIEAGTYSLVFSFIGLQEHRDTIVLERDIVYNVFLEEEQQQLKEVVVEASELRRESEEVQMSKVQLTSKQIENLPSILGEKDMLRVLQLKPGVQSGGEASSGIFVRGGGSDQNLFLLDDASVYNASHLFGFFSVFNGDALKGISLYKGGFPARYGGRLSSVLNITMKEGNKKEWHGKVAIGVISFQTLLEGPLYKDKTSVLFSARRSYLDPFLELIGRQYDTDTTSSRTNYFMHDYNFKVNHEFNSKHKLYFSSYYGKDKFSFENRTTSFDAPLESKARTETRFSPFISWGNIIGTLRWNHQITPQTFANLSLISSDYSFDVQLNLSRLPAKGSKKDEKIHYKESNRFLSQIRNFSLKYDVEYFPTVNHSLRFGTLQTLYRSKPNTYSLTRDDSLAIDRTNLSYAYSSAFYAEDEINYGNFRANVGFRLLLYQHEEKVFWLPEPRLSLFYRIIPGLSVKGAYTWMHQPLHLLGVSGSSLPTDVWVTATKNIGPQFSDQIALGLVQEIGPKANYVLTVEGYYKTSSNVIAYKEGVSVGVDPFYSRDDDQSFDWESLVTVGTGYASGLEFSIEKKRGAFTGWIAYTLAYARQRFPYIQNNVPFFPRYDRRHDVSIVGNYKITPTISFSFSWIYNTGAPFTIKDHIAYLPTFESVLRNTWERPNDPAREGPDPPPSPIQEEDRVPNSTSIAYKRFNFRSEDYHRLDFNVQFRKRVGKNKRHVRVWQVGCYNTYNRSNPFSYSVSREEDRFELLRTPLFPIIPFVTYRYEF